MKINRGMKKKKLEDFIKKVSKSKELSDDQLIDCAKKCIKNADDLLSSAELLLKKKLYGPSLFNSVIALEELGKGNFAQSILMEQNPSKFHWFVFWKCFFDHKSKIRSVIFPNYILEKDLEGNPLGWQEMFDLYPKFEKSSKEFHVAKLQGLYVEFDKKKEEFVTPTISSKMAEQYLENGKKNLALVSWVKDIKNEDLKSALKISGEFFKEQNIEFENFLHKNLRKKLS
jgi:AbiV family abortive infection protein